MIRFHPDQHVSNRVAGGLRLRGIDVTTTAEAGLQDASDEQQIEYIRTTGRVIFTQDHGFLQMHRADFNHPGIVYSKQGTRSIGTIVRFLQLMIDCLEPEEMRGRIEYF